jgi:enoyl-CoA hydratase/carnithine racemase
MPQPQPSSDDDKPLAKIERQGAVGIVSFNEPHRLNPLSTYTGGSEDQVTEYILELERDNDIRAIVITGEGRAFSAGADAKKNILAHPTVSDVVGDVLPLRALSASPFPDAGRGWSMWYVLERCSKPLIAAVHGWCIAGGWEIALFCDMIVADETAQFGLAQVERGLFPAHATYLLARAIGRWRAAELSYTGRRIGAAEAASLGLVSRLVPEGKDIEAAIELAQEIARYPLPALAGNRRALNRATIPTSDWEQNRRDFVLVQMSESARQWSDRWRVRMSDRKNRD